MTRAKGGIVLEDGPAAGTYSTRRAPHWLRATTTSRGNVDLLDQLNDEPTSIETVHVYEAAGPLWDPSSLRRRGIIVCPPPGASGHYRHRPDVNGEQLRATEAWRAWCRAQPATVPLFDETTGNLVMPGPEAIAP